MYDLKDDSNRIGKFRPSNKFTASQILLQSEQASQQTRMPMSESKSQSRPNSRSGSPTGSMKERMIMKGKNKQ